MTTAVDTSVTITPVLDGDRPVGAWIAGPETAVFRPVVDLTRITAAVVSGLAAITAITVIAAARRRPAVGPVTMGPGGWVSVRGCSRPHPRSRRPLWARLTGAEPVRIRASRSRRHRDNGPAGRRHRDQG